MEKDWKTIGKMGKLWEHMGQPYMGNYGKIWEHDGKHREIMGNQRNWSEMVKWWENDGWVDKQNQGVAPCISRIISSFQHHYQKTIMLSCSYLNHHFPWWSHHVCWVESSFFMIFQAPSLLGNLLGPWVPGLIFVPQRLFQLGETIPRSRLASLGWFFDEMTWHDMTWIVSNVIQSHRIHVCHIW